MMRKIFILVVAGILFLLLGVRLWGSASIYRPTAIPFPYDPNAVQYKLLGGINVRAGQEVVVDINCYDPDGDAFSIRVLNWQSGMNLTISTDPNNPTKLKWAPTAEQAGLHYINIEAWDFPPDPNDSLTDRGTYVFNIRPRNRPPILLPWN
jgi:hypothetical protein